MFITITTSLLLAFLGATVLTLIGLAEFPFLILANASVYWDFMRGKGRGEYRKLRSTYIVLNLIAVPVFVFTWIFFNIGAVG